MARQRSKIAGSKNELPGTSSCGPQRQKSIPSIVYWDSPFNIEDSFIDSSIYNNHREDLVILIETKAGGNVILGSAFEANVKRFDEAVESAIDGKLENTKDGLRYRSASGYLFSIKNVAAGIKVFATIRMLVDKGILYEGSILMLDEPEVHLHPQWINILGDVIHILVRELHVKVLLTTHNPQLLMALESSFKGDDHVRYYNLKRSDDGSPKLEDVGDRLEQIYDEMSAPIQDVASRFWE